jgi:flagellar biosynthesis GTPase FlhF
MSDLLNKLGKKTETTSEGAGKTSGPQATSTGTSTTAEHSRGDDLLGKVASNNSPEAAANANSSAVTDTTSRTSISEEPNGNSPDWTTDSAMKEVKKLREENKAYRIKYQQEVEKLRQESDLRTQSIKDELEKAKNAEQELAKIKAEQEDKKRDITEKLVHREARIQELESQSRTKQEELLRKIQDQENIVRQYQAEREAEAGVYQNKVDDELSKIPAKYQDYAKLLVKGAGEPREALVALSEAKIRGMFDDKTIVVNHSTPGAGEGARASKERLEEGDKARRNSMSSSQKIGEALKSIKGGNPNNVFRTK